MMKAIRHGLGNLLNGSGRDARQAFWYYVLFVYIVTTILSTVVITPIMIKGFISAVRQGIAVGESGDPSAVEPVVQAGMASAMADMMQVIVWMTVGTGVVMLVLLGAAFVRRLHDSDLSGYWALIPGGVQIVYLALMPSLMSSTMARMMETMQQAPIGDPMAGMQAMQASLTSVSLLGWGAMIVIVVLGIRKSTPGPNRYGEEPFVA